MAEELFGPSAAPSAREPSFAATDLTDGRSQGNWESRYARGPKWRIAAEATYVGLLLVGIPFLLVLAYVHDLNFLSATADRTEVVRYYVLVYMAGAFGGALFTTKWLYHSVAHGYWNKDRLFWRLFTPFLSAGTATAFIALIRSRALPLISTEVISSLTGAVALAILIGYFSDKAVGRMNKFADRIFGDSQGATPPQATAQVEPSTNE